jgi:hypothetical protein
MGGKIVRTIGIARARLKIGMMNLGFPSAAPTRETNPVGTDSVLR